MGGSLIRKALHLFAIVAVFAVLASCTQKLRDKFDPDKHDHIDRHGELSRDDYLNMAEPKEGELIEKVEIKPPPPPPIPSLSQILTSPRPPEIGEKQLVSISVTDDVPLKDVLLELARLAEVDIELDAGIRGGISFIAKEKPFNQVISRIADMAGLRYTMDDDVLRIERDIPYIETYALDFLNIERSAESAVNISTNVLSASGSEGGGGGLNTGSTQTITSATTSDFWSALRVGVEQILNYAPSSKMATVKSYTVNGENIVADPGGLSDGGSESGGEGRGADRRAGEDCAMNSGDASAGGGQSSGSGDAVTVLTGGDCKTFYTFNRQAGILTVSATRRQHDLVERFVNRIKVSASAQVLIEAKIVEISLNDKYQSGIEWSALNNKLGIITDFNNVDITNGLFSVSLPNRAIDGLSGDTDGPAGADLDDFIQLMEEFGTSRTLSSPRLHAINNQQAVLTFAENLVYFEINVERETDTTTGTNQELLTVDSEVKTVPIGIILTLQPSVNVDTGEITLIVRPTLSRVTGSVADPAVAFLASQGGVNIENRIPVVEVRELDSILKLQSGQVMVIGGLMERSSHNTDIGVPGVSSVPWLGNLFKAVSKEDQTQELVIFIKATLVSNRGNVSKADRTIYEKFTNDPRPLTF